MTLDKDVNDLLGDGFEGSINEHRIFTEVFFGNDQGKASKKCVVTGAINFQSDKSRPTDLLLSQNSETSAISSLLNVSNMNSLQDNSGPWFKGETLPTNDDNVANGKRIKLNPDEQPVFNSVTCRLVEITNQGITSSCYLLKGDVYMHSLPSFNENDEKEISAWKAITSPVSQESSAKMSQTLRTHGERKMKSDGGNLSREKRPFHKDISKSPRNLLREYIQDLLKAVGWEIIVRRKINNAHWGYIYLSPQTRRSIRELPKVWNLCGQSLSIDRTLLALKDGKQWNNLSSFWSDLSLTVGKIDEEPSLAQQWCLLDPFVNLVYIEKKLDLLKAGDVVEAGTTLVIDSDMSDDDESAKMFQTLRTRGKRKLKSDDDDDNLYRDKRPFHKDISKSPRTLLRKYTWGLLKAVGWEITVRRRNNNDISGYIYLSPQTRRSMYELHKVWNLCGQSLSIDRTLLVLKDGKQWSDMSSFWSDLSLTLDEIDEEPSLAQQWCLLDPFVNLVFIEKKLNFLKAGQVVEARSSLTIDPYMNEDALISSKKGGRIGNQSKKGSPDGLCESSLVGVSVLTNTEANNYAGMGSCGTRITVDLGQLNRGTVRALNGVPFSLSEEKCTFAGTTNGLNLNAIQANDLDGNSDHSSSCINEVPITPQNEMAVLAESVSPLDDSTKSLVEDNNLKTPQAQYADVHKSSVIKKKNSKSFTQKSTRKSKVYKSEPLKKLKTQNGSCRLLPRSVSKGGKHNEKKWFIIGSRTVLSWLISCGTVSLKEVIQYRNSKDNSVVKEGLITKNGILCTCCKRVLSVAKFKYHAGFRLNRSCLNLVMGSGKSFTLCQLEAWSNEFKIRKSAKRPVDDEDLDQNDDTCGLCGDGGDLICCDNCPSTFHQKCLCDQELPEGDWYCQHCSCRICGDLVVDKEATLSTGALKCSQCDHKYHEACLKENVVWQDSASETRFCVESCQEAYLGLQSYVGALNCLSDGYTWTLLRCIHGDQKVHPAQRFIALKAECNSKLAVALTIMEECFLSMVDRRTGIDMIPHILYNWGSEFTRLDCNGFYTMVLEKDDMLISVASIRIHGVTVAEMPLIATCSKYRRQGMCRRLMNSIEEMLISFKVEKLVITAIPDVVETWTLGFGFEPLQDDERKSLSHVNLMVFPGTVWLKKTMYKKQATCEQTSSGHAAPFCKEDQVETHLCSDGVLTVEIGNRHTYGDMGDNDLHEDFSKMSLDKSASSETESQPQPIVVGESANIVHVM